MGGDVAHIALGMEFKNGGDIFSFLNKLRVIIKPLKRQEIRTIERALLFAYTYHFEELPPLNFNFPGRQNRKPQKKQLRWAKRWILNA